ncbi:MAG: peptidylprolyl isomerase [Planctomycetota bacterium]
MRRGVGARGLRRAGAPVGQRRAGRRRRRAGRGGGGRARHEGRALRLPVRPRARAWLDGLDELVDERIVGIEARALGVTVPPAVLVAAVDAEVDARRRQLVERFGPSADLDASVRAYYGLDVAGWRAQVLEPRLRTRLALARVVRLSARLRDQVVARVLVVKDRATADAVRAKLDRGADFSLTALEVSVDPSRSLGGVIPPIARGDLARPELEAALFAAAPGSVLGPLEVATGAAVEWHLYKVVERVPAWGGAPSSLLPRLEDDLAKAPVTRAEFERWSSRTRARYGVRYFAPDGSVLPGGGGGR